VVNPRAGCGVQQTRGAVEGAIFGSRLCGENRWSREERQERNERETWQSRAEAWTTVQAGVDA